MNGTHLAVAASHLQSLIEDIDSCVLPETDDNRTQMVLSDIQASLDGIRHRVGILLDLVKQDTDESE